MASELNYSVTLSIEAEDEPSTLVQLLRRRAEAQPTALAYTFLADGETEEVSYTYAELDRQARIIGAHLQRLGAQGERVMLIYPPCLEYIAAFFGCLYAGAVAVPVYPPRQNRTLLRFAAIAQDAAPVAALTTSQSLSRAQMLLEETDALRACHWVASDALAPALADEWREPSLDAETLAFLQYTSGSTATPKGVMVSHGNLLHNQRVIQTACGHTSRSTFVGWLPLYHDMGLIGNVLQPLYIGARCVLMSPVAFLQKPLRWLEAISRYRAATSGGPNFAYDLCVRTVSEEQRRALDLSSWTVAFNGAEPVRHHSLEQFASAFAPAGFRRQSFFPCYGLAEATLFVSGGSPAERPVLYTVEAAELEQNRIVLHAGGAADARTLVGCGQAWLDQKILIVDPETLAPCSPNRVGEIWLSGRSVTQGYWNRPEETEHAFRAYPSQASVDASGAPFFRTGDLGFLRDGELFVTGRLKDLIIIRGRNLYPQDIELSVQRCDKMLRPGCGAAFSVEVEGEERLVVVQEAEQRRVQESDALFETVRQAMAEEYEVQLYAFVLIRPGSLPKTSSGKIQRRMCRALFLDGGLNVLAEWRGVGAAGGVATPPQTSIDSTSGAEAIESWLVARLASMLCVAAGEIDVHQPITRYGLDSLAAIELMHSLESELDVKLPIVSFLNPTIAELAAQAAAVHAKALSSSARPGAMPAQEAAEVEHPLSVGQQALWFLHQLAPESAAYNISVALKLLVPVDVPAFIRALQALVNRHPSLRTSFASRQGSPVQLIEERAEAAFVVVDASAWGAEVLREHLTAEAHRPFDLERGPLMRVTLYTGAANEQYLLLAIHHIIADMWSLDVLMRELGILYRQERTGEHSSLPALPLRYTDFIRWQAEMLRGTEGERLWSYWQRQLDGELPILNLPFDRPRPPAQSSRGGSQPLKLSAELTERLKALSRSHDATLYMTLLAAFQVLLHRYTGQDDILVGSPSAGRNWAELRNVVGYFVNPLVMRANLAGNPSFAEFLARVRRVVMEAYEHQDYPFASLVERLQPVRAASHSPLFQAMFALQKSNTGDDATASFALGEAGARMELGELSVESIALEQRVAQFDLSLMMAEVEGRLTASLQYNADLFDRETVARLGANLLTLLESVAEDTAQRVSSLPLLTADERHQLLVEWNHTLSPYPQHSAIHHLFEQQAQRSPHALAVSCADAQLSYAELDARANQLARFLRHHGVARQSLVAVLLPRTAELIVALLGVLKAGAAYVPLDGSYPEERLRMIVEETGAAVVLTSGEMSWKVEGAGRAVVLRMEEEREEIGRESAEVVESGVGGEELAYVIYTSGSTGRPKGVAIEHRSAVALWQWSQQVFTRAELEGVLASTSVCFDLSIFEIFVTLGCGGTVVLVENVLHLAQSNHARPVTLINTVPSAMTELLRLDAVPTSVRTVNLAGEALPRHLVEQVYDRGHVERVFNLYGPSEDTTYSTWALMCRGDDRAPTIGRPINNTQLYILNAALEPTPVGVAGELYIAGAGLARGYLNRPELTAERFIPHPFSTTPGARLYRTGDMVRYLAGGAVEYLGRTDEQVKIRGFRIEPGEIQSMLSEHHSIRDCAVLAQPDGRGHQHLVAYLTLHHLLSPDESHRQLEHLWREHLQQRLPDYMLPAAFLVLDSLPLTANGKLDRSKLPPVELRGRGEGSGAQTYVEEELVAVWEEVLGVEGVGREDEFFALGGHSLVATRVVSRVRERLGVDVPLRTLFERPTIAGLAAFINDNHPGRQASIPIDRSWRDEPGVLPALSYAQQRLWLLDQLEPESTAYHLPIALRLKGRLNEEALQRSLEEIAGRHEILRTTCGVRDGRPVQFIAREATIPLRLVSLEELAEDEREREARRLSDLEAKVPFSLSDGPLVRAVLLRLGAQEHVLLITLHHIVADGWSMSILFRELASLYASLSTGAPATLPELPVQYADYAVWQRSWLEDGELERQLRYWKRQLDGELPVLELPCDYLRPIRQSMRGAQERRRVPAELTGKLKALSGGEGATLFMTLLAAFQVLLHRYTGQDDIIVGSPIAGRTRSETENLIGFFLNTLVLRTDVSGRPTFRELLGRVREVTLGAYLHQDVPFEKLLEELPLARDLSRTPLFQVFFNYLNFPAPVVEMAGLEVEALPVAEIGSKFDLTLYVEDVADEIVFTASYNADLFAPARIEEMLEQLCLLLSQAVEEPTRRVDEYSLHTARAQALLPDPAQALDATWRGSVHALFAEQARRVPASLAVRDEKDSWTYEELEQRSNQLANYLRASGVGRGDVVALYGHRSASFVWGLIGITKAGAAFMILDPKHPPLRLLEYVKAGQPTAWLQVCEAGAVPEALAAYIEDGAWRCRLELPSLAVAVASGMLAHYAVEAPLDTTGPDDLAYIAFTSGSTGKPKGIEGRHGPLTHFLSWLRRSFDLGETDRFSMLSGLSHDPLHRDVFVPLQLGAAICIPPPHALDVPGQLAAWMKRERISVANLTPAMGQLLTGAASGEPAREVETLRRAFFVGDVLTRRDVAALRRLAPDALCVNFYGATETQQALACFVVTPELIEDESAQPGRRMKEVLPLGSGIADVQTLVLNGSSQLAGIGELGEVCFRSPHLARGYLNDEALTRQRFISNPFTGRARDRLYRTGDLARYSLDGAIEFAGRTDEQVKIRGFRIEPGEIQSMLSEHHSVRDCAVLAQPDATGHQHLVAYLTLHHLPAPDESHRQLEHLWREHLQQRLPEYMLPAAFLVLDSLPLTANGKLDRSKLPPVELRGRGEGSGAQTYVEEELVAVWEEVLGVEGVGREDEFFALGGHSLVATRVVSRVRERLGVEVPLRTLFERPTLRDMAAAIEERMLSGDRAQAPPITPAPRHADLPLSSAQQRVWFLDQLEGGTSAYNVPGAVRLSGALSVAALERALGEVVRRHEVLRTTFHTVDARPVQVVSPAQSLELKRIDLSGLPSLRQQDEIETLAAREAETVFDLTTGPLLRVHLLRLGPQEHVVLFTMHHIICDGWSFGVLIREVSALYEAYAKGERSPLGELPIQYADFAVWQREWLRGEVLERQVDYWRRQLAGAPASLDLPTDRPRSALRHARGATQHLALSPQLTGALKELSRREGVTLFMLMLAAFNVLLQRYTKQDDIVVGSNIANRNRHELEGLIGFFVNNLVLRTDLSGNPTFAELVERTRQVCLGAYAHQDVPFEKLVEELRPERRLDRNPLFQILFVHQNTREEVEELSAGLKMTPLDLQAVTIPFEMILNVREQGGGLVGALHYSTALFDAATVGRLLEQYRILLENVVENPHERIGSLSMIAPSESDELIRAFND